MPVPPTAGFALLDTERMTVEDRARELHRRGIDAINRGRPVLGARSLQAGLRLLGWPVPAGEQQAPTLTARLLISLALAEAAQGNTPRGFALLDQAAALLPPEQGGVLRGG